MTPHLRAPIGQLGKAPFDVGFDFRRTGSSEELGDVPPVLNPARVQLQQYQVGYADDWNSPLPEPHR